MRGAPLKTSGMVSMRGDESASREEHKRIETLSAINHLLLRQQLIQTKSLLPIPLPLYQRQSRLQSFQERGWIRCVSTEVFILGNPKSTKFIYNSVTNHNESLLCMSRHVL
jgi:hypothetical protein